MRNHIQQTMLTKGQYRDEDISDGLVADHLRSSGPSSFSSHSLHAFYVPVQHGTATCCLETYFEKA